MKETFTLRRIIILSAAVLVAFWVFAESEHREESARSKAIGAEPAEAPDKATDSENVALSAAVHRETNSNLLYAASWGQIEIVTSLLNAGADINAREINGDTPLIAAAAHGQIEIVKLLLEKGADIDATNITGSTALIEAASVNQIEVVRALLARGAALNLKNIEGLTALVAATRGGNQTVAQLIGSHSINGTAQPKLNAIGPMVPIGGTDLRRFAKEGNVEKIRNLIGLGAQINSADENGWTPLMHASFSGNSAAAKLLLANRADPGMRDASGRNALILATMKGDADIVKALLNGGADPNVKDKTGNSPISIVQASGRVDVGRLLKQAGAKTPTYSQVVSPQ